MNSNEPTFVRFEEAQQYILHIEDSKTRELVSLLLSKATHAFLRGDPPLKIDFDVMYFVKIAEQAMSRHSAIQLVMNGETLAWPE